MERSRPERNSLLSSSSSGNDNNLRQSAVASGSSSSNANNNNRNSNSSTECASSASGNNNSNSNNSNNNGNNNNSASAAGLFRSRKQPSTLGGSGRGNKHFNNLNSLAEPASGVAIMPTAYDERAMMTLPPSYQAAATASTGGGNPNNLNHINNNSFVNSNSLNNNSGRSNYYSTIDDECDPVERRNRINAQLSASAATIHNGGPGVSTIFRNGRPPCNNNNQNHHNHHPTSAGNRSRTNPRSLDRRRFIHNNNNNNNATNGSNLAVISPQDPSQYIYHEPVFHEGLIYDACLSYSDRSSGGSAGPPYPYILPQFTTFRNHGAGHGPHQAIYSRDSSFGSDSGYSQHTQASSRSAGWSRNRLTPQQQIQQQHQQLQQPKPEPQQAVADS